MELFSVIFFVCVRMAWGLKETETIDQYYKIVIIFKVTNIFLIELRVLTIE